MKNSAWPNIFKDSKLVLAFLGNFWLQPKFTKKKLFRCQEQLFQEKSLNICDKWKSLCCINNDNWWMIRASSNWFVVLTVPNLHEIEFSLFRSIANSAYDMKRHWDELVAAKQAERDRQKLAKLDEWLAICVKTTCRLQRLEDVIGKLENFYGFCIKLIWRKCIDELERCYWKIWKVLWLLHQMDSARFCIWSYYNFFR